MVRGIARLAAAICGVWLSIALVDLASLRHGLMQQSLQSVRNAGNCLVVALLVWGAMSDWFLNFARADWRSWSLFRLAVLGVVSLNLLLAFRNVVYYPEHVVLGCLHSRDLFPDTTDQGSNQRASAINNFAARCRQALPPNARILFHGSLEALVFAYEVYPRKVFRLPSEGIKDAANLQLRPWLKEIPQDPLEPYWRRELPSGSEDREAFIKAHGITHEVYFQADQSANCRWEKVQ